MPSWSPVEISIRFYTPFGALVDTAQHADFAAGLFYGGCACAAGV
ncbi:hypothetical protein [Alicyclobacillus suci]|nr:hypothetical protein [Alicyclobacillus suci]